MAFDWSGFGGAMSGLVNALGQSGVQPGTTAFSNIMNSVGGLVTAANPNKAVELQLCSEILAMAGNPAVVASLGEKLIEQYGLPQAAANLATQLMQPGADIVKITLEIEQIIKNGG